MSLYKKGIIVKGCVTGIEPYGVFVNLDEYYNGLIHISEVSDGFVKNINDFVNIGDTIFARVIDIDEELYKVKLSIKNIDYKVDGKRVRKPIKETGLGFKLLADNLNKWIAEKVDEINKK